MILNEMEIKEIILKNPNKHLIEAGRKYNKEMRKHLYGENLEVSLSTIDGIESKVLHSIRVKYARSNRDLFSRLSRPIDKVFSARGGSLYYNLPESGERKARMLASSIRGNMSIKKWNDNSWRKHYLDDPAGVVFMEMYKESEAVRLNAQGKSISYPTYKSIQCIYDYLPNGTNLEYIVFTMSAKDKAEINLKPEDIIYRVVDDSADYYVKREGETVTILTQYTLPNLFMQVPAMLNSDIPNPNIEGGVVSIFDDVLELANHFLMTGSVKLTHDFLHAYPKYWEYADSCKACKGTGVVEGAVCKTCNGSKIGGVSSVSDAKLITWPRDKDTPTVTPDVAGYVSPDKNYHEMSHGNLQILEDLMNFTIWGASSQQKTSGMGTDQAGQTKTATEIVNEIQPKSDRLEPISEYAECIHKFILDSIIRIQISQSYPGSSVNYGKRYMTEGPDVIWQKYSDSRAKGVAYSVLDDLLMEYYEAKYNSDPVKLAIQSKLMKVEPFVHFKVSEVKALGCSDDEYKAKLYFGEWLSTLNEAMLIAYDATQLKEMMVEYIGKKQLAAPPETKLLPAA